MQVDSKKFHLEGGGEYWFLNLKKNKEKKKLFLRIFESKKQKPGVRKVALFSDFPKITKWILLCYKCDIPCIANK